MAVCYRHPDRETGVSCSNCGNPICPDCMTPTPVGMRCPECARQRTQVKTVRTMYAQPTATYVLIGLNVLLFVGTSFAGAGGIGRGDLGLSGPAIDPSGEYWRIVTSGFVHAGLIHLLFNMYVLYWLGTMLEPALGHARFVALYFASLLCGAFGVLLLDPQALTVGASGAVFGLFGGAFVFQRARGVNPMQSGIGPVILLNLAITFVIPNISIGGHLGGLVGGALTALLMDRVAHVRRGDVLPVATAVAIGAVAVAGCLAVAGGTGLLA